MRTQTDDLAEEGRRGKLDRKRIVEAEPGNRQPAFIAQPQVYRHLISKEGVVHKAPLDIQLLDGILHP